MLAVTSNDLPGYEIRRVLGEVFGITVRRLGWASGGAFSGVFSGGEVPGATRMILECRNEAMNRLIVDAQRRGANAIVAMRFDTGALGDGVNEVCAYGTAVWAAPVTDEAQAQYAALVAARRVPPLEAVAPPATLPPGIPGVAFPPGRPPGA